MLDADPRRWSRTTLAVLLASSALVMAAITAIATAFFVVGAGSEQGPRAGLAQIDGLPALVIVMGDDQAAAAVSRWGMFAPAFGLAIAAIVAWILAGKVLRLVRATEARAAAADLEQQSRLQEVVHELRTPLAVIGSNLELAAADTAALPDVAGYVSAARRAADRMARTVDDLAGHGGLTVEDQVVPVDLAAVAESVVVEHIGPGRAAGVRVRLAAEGALTVPAADPGAIRTAISNFVGNAVRLAPRGSEVRLCWGQASDWAWITVVDEGPGLAPHLHARAFERGWQGQNGGQPSEAGSGLGLTIARQLTEAQGGVVTIDSAEGQGAAFTVWIPLSRDADKSTVVDDDRLHPSQRPWNVALAGR